MVRSKVWVAACHRSRSARSAAWVAFSATDPLYGELTATQFLATAE
jgi:hypothetical protein